MRGFVSVSNSSAAYNSTHIWFSHVQHLRCSELYRNCKMHFLWNEAHLNCSTPAPHILPSPLFFRLSWLCVVLQCASRLESCSIMWLFHYAKRKHTKQESDPEEVSLKQMLSPDAESKASEQQASTYKQSPCEVKRVLPWPQCKWIACKVWGTSEIWWQWANISKH